MLPINKSLYSQKNELLSFFRDQATKKLELVKKTHKKSGYKKMASKINKLVIQVKDDLLDKVLQKANEEKWNNKVILNCVLMITYTNYIVMIEMRNEVWPYEYMSFSRRIGELWEPFCKICFDYPITNISQFDPPTFSEVRNRLSINITSFIKKLKITDSQKSELKKYYDEVWALVTSGEIKLELDLHFELNRQKYVVDFKSGFGSNEKGNTNRLLLVATIYKNLNEKYKCVILVRSDEDRNNNYFQTLKNSAVWEAYSGKEAYAKIKEYSGFDMHKWIEVNIDWEHDFKKETLEQLKKGSLEEYLIW